MTSATRRRGSKRLQWRSAGGRYAVAPSLAVRRCGCGGLILRTTTSGGRFERPRWPDACASCSPLADDKAQA